MLLVPSPASAKPRLDWCAEAVRASRQADDLNQRLADLDQQIGALSVQLAQLTASGGEVGAAPPPGLVQAQVASLVNQKRSVTEVQQVAAAAFTAVAPRCIEQAANPPRCPHQQPLTAAQLNGPAAARLREAMARVLGDTSGTYRPLFALYRCPTAAPR